MHYNTLRCLGRSDWRRMALVKDNTFVVSVAHVENVVLLVEQRMQINDQ